MWAWAVLTTGLFLLCTGLALAYVQCRTQRTALQESLGQARKEAESLQEKSSLHIQRLAQLEAENTHLQSHIAQHQKSQESLQSQLTLEFKHLASTLLEEKGKLLGRQQREALDQLLHPLADKLMRFEASIHQHNKDHLERNVALRTEIQRLSALGSQMSTEANNLTNALKGEQKTQGQWGELILATVLQNSGLREGQEYFSQESTYNAEGQRYQPDVVVKLPDDKHIIIDAKVSLLGYERFCNAASDSERTQALGQHIASLRKHIKSLGEKSYQNLYPGHPDFVLMFIPIEPAFSLATQQEHGLFQEAYAKNIILVSPATLMATLRTIANLWRYADQNQNAQEIARQAGALYDKLVGFVEDMQHMGRQLAASQKTYDEAMQKLAQGRGNLIRKAEHIKTLGARTRKQLPEVT